MFGKICLIFILIHLLIQIKDGQTDSIEEMSKKTKILKQRFTKATKLCSAEHNTTLLATVAILNEKKSGDTNTKCFLFCMLQNHDLMDINGNYQENNFPKFVDKIPESKFLKSIQKNLPECVKEDAKKHCDKAYRFIKCFYQRGMLE